jgi:hypothetical protein
MASDDQRFVQAIANLRYRTQRQPQDDDRAEGREYMQNVSRYHNNIDSGNEPCARCEGFGAKGEMYDCSRIVPIFRPGAQHMICLDRLSDLGRP